MNEETKEVWLKGLTGFELEFHTEEEAEESFENLFDWDWFDFYIDYLKNTNDWNCTYYDWQEMVKSEKDSDFDDSFCNYGCVQDALEYASEKEDIEYKYTNCVWCGRHFNDENVKTKYFEYYNKENLRLLQKLYKEYEK